MGVVFTDALIEQCDVYQQIGHGSSGPAGQVLQFQMRTTPYRIGLLGQYDAELGHQAPDAVDGGGAFFVRPQ